MKKGNGSISKGKTYQEIGEFWDTHNLADYWDRTRPAAFEVDLKSHLTYCALDNDVSKRLRIVARKRGVPANTLVNLWLQEKLQAQAQR